MPSIFLMFISTVAPRSAVAPLLGTTLSSKFKQTGGGRRNSLPSLLHLQWPKIVLQIVLHLQVSITSQNLQHKMKKE